MVDEDPLGPATAALAGGDPEQARALVDRAIEAHPDDPRVRELYTALHLARAVRLSALARDARRQDVVRRAIPYDAEFEDGPDVVKAFDDASAAIEEVLARDPRQEKALMLKASLLFRRNRETGRPAALEILESIMTANPENRQALYAIRKIEAPCKRCGDSGFCTRCRGRGSKRILGFEQKCDACHGQGICLACGIL